MEQSFSPRYSALEKRQRVVNALLRGWLLVGAAVIAGATML